MRRPDFGLPSRVLLLAAAMVLLWPPSPGWNAEQIRLRAWSHADYVRLVFDWASPVDYRAVIEDKQLVVRFGRPLETEFGQVQKFLADYIAAARLAGDGKVVRFDLKGDYGLRHFVNEGSVVLDLLRPGVGSPRPKTVAEATVRVRVGEHDGFSRVVFDWSGHVDYSVRQQGTGVTMRFRRRAKVSAERLLGDPPRGVEGARVTPQSDGFSVDFSIPGGARLRHFRDGLNVVVDVVLGQETWRPRIEDGGAGATAPRPGAKAATEGPAAEAKGAGVPTPPAQEAAGPLVPAAAVPPPPLPADIPAAAPIAPVETVAAPAEEPAAAPTADQVVAAAAPGISQDAAPLVPDGTADRPPDWAGVSVRSEWTPTEVPKDAPAMEVAYRADLDGAVLAFPFRRPTRAAAFRRAGYLWLVFDTLVRIDIQALSEAGAELVAEVRQIGHGGATVLRLATAQGFNPVLDLDDTEWTVTLRPVVMNPATAIEPKIDGEAYGGRVRFVTKDAGDVVSLRDPEVGDDIWVVPFAVAGLGIEQEYDFHDLRLMRTAQGIAIVSLNDGLRFRRDRNGIDISRDRGLTVSPNSDRALGQGWSADGAVAMRIFDFVGWRGDATLDFLDAKLLLQDKVVSLSGSKRNAARLELARFYFARGAAADALGVIGAMVREEPDLILDPAYRALRGASYYLMGNYNSAAKDLGAQALDAEPEIQLWRGALAAAAADWETAIRGFRRGAMFLDHYPDKLALRFRLQAAEVALNNNDAHEAGILLEALGKMQFDKVADRARFNVMRGRLLALRDEPEAAVQLLDWAIAVGDRRGRAEAIFARTELLLAEGQLSTAEAIDGFDRLRFVWRGDEFEFAVMRRLGELRIAEGDIRGGLITLKRAATNFPSHPQAKALTLEMGDMFRELYTGDGADSMSPVSAIALFEEFRELVPTGEQGDAMIQRLADRLFAVDLLDKAAALLAHQVEYRLEGVDKARVGARLALIHLLNGDAVHAFTALRQSEVVGVPTSLQSERRLLKARTQIELGQPAEALIVLAGDSSAAADRLRAQIHWHAKEWRTAAAAYGRLAGPLPAAGEAFSDDRSRYVLSQAVALSLAGEQEQVAELRRRVGAAMDGTAYAADFRVVAVDEPRARDLEAVQKRIAAVDDFRAFLANYRERVARGGLATID